MNAETFNSFYPVGIQVVAYPFVRPEHPVAVRYREAVAAGLSRKTEDDPCTRLVTRTRSVAQVLGGHTDVVWVDGHGACIALTHIDVIAEPAPEWRHQDHCDPRTSGCCACVPEETL